MGRPVDWWVLDLDADPVPGDAEQVRQLATALADFAMDADAFRRAFERRFGIGPLAFKQRFSRAAESHELSD